MSQTVADYLVTDDLTILLGLIAATVFLVNNLYKPQPLVHPILLGRQSDVGRARNPGESAVYRNYGTGLMGRFPIRPGKDVHILLDLVRAETEGPRTLWGTKLTNRTLQDRAAALGTGLIRLAGLKPNQSTVLLLLNDGFEFLLTDLALASHGIVSYTLSSAKLLSSVLDSHRPSAIVTHAAMLPGILELIYDSDERQNEYTIVVVDELPREVRAGVASNIKLLPFEDVEREGVRVEKILSPVPKPSDVFTISLYEGKNGMIQGAQLTHENFTAGVAAIHALLPASHTFSTLDTIASAHSLSTAFGRAVAYTALYEGTGFATLPSSIIYEGEDDHPSGSADYRDLTRVMGYPIPFPTVLFLKPEHLRSTTDEILQHARKASLLYRFGWRHKLAGITDGFLTRDSLWDRMLFDSARNRVLGKISATTRAVIVSGGPVDADLMTPARIAFSVPVINTLSHPLVAAPVLASHAFDLQDFSLTGTSSQKPLPAHTGPPGVNVEVKLVGVDDEKVESGGDPVGVMYVRGPPVAKLVNVEGYVEVPSGDDDGWTGLGVRAKVQTNGSFVEMID
ncbi:acetyl-CoA synthetase [Coprinopsis cinerea okayama7|uniref:Acetyl-CoA synthetase n=1 Tax=Coprinopsis cinerea (strain Okayama-7 / 130 / ATCC MYA-4618 / FGSC 9003) TaxID=240176 RepID=A8NGT5_COPC7|nr:acetyl-CoA synthetase [Coprinopsis cinerea okayama7\|eukprot:XP_001833594.1 acetyl-CoA synthetase [Coprinopsis cinerea okayama7\